MDEQYDYASPYEQSVYMAQVKACDTNDNRPWLLTDFDTWVRNPNYNGPPNPPHPEDEID